MVHVVIRCLLLPSRCESHRWPQELLTAGGLLDPDVSDAREQAKPGDAVWLTHRLLGLGQTLSC